MISAVSPIPPTGPPVDGKMGADGGDPPIRWGKRGEIGVISLILLPIIIPQWFCYNNSVFALFYCLKLSPNPIGGYWGKILTVKLF